MLHFIQDYKTGMNNLLWQPCTILWRGGEGGGSYLREEKQLSFHAKGTTMSFSVVDKFNSCVEYLIFLIEVNGSGDLLIFKFKTNLFYTLIRA